VGEWGSVHWLRDRLGLPAGEEAPRFAPPVTAEVA
jgi:hypothetical protein